MRNLTDTEINQLFQLLKTTWVNNLNNANATNSLVEMGLVDVVDQDYYVISDSGKELAKTTDLHKMKQLHIEKREKLSNELAEFFNDGTQVGPCACDASNCTTINCSYFWECFLEEHNHDEIREMIDLYQQYKRRMNNL